MFAVFQKLHTASTDYMIKPQRKLKSLHVYMEHIALHVQQVHEGKVGIKTSKNANH